MPGRARGWRRGRSRRAVRILEPALLLLLHRGPAHGYTLLERLGEFGLADLSPSVVYRVLREMEGCDWVTSTWDDEQTQGPPRRVYCITPTGSEVLGRCTQDLEETRRMIDYLLGMYSEHVEGDTGEYR